MCQEVTYFDGFSIKEVPQYVDGFLTYPRDMVNLVDQQTLINIAETTVDRNEFLQRVMELEERKGKFLLSICVLLLYTSVLIISLI